MEFKLNETDLRNSTVTTVMQPTIILRLSYECDSEYYKSVLIEYQKMFSGINVILLRKNDADVIEILTPPHSKMLNN